MRNKKSICSVLFLLVALLLSSGCGDAGSDLVDIVKWVFRPAPKYPERNEEYEYSWTIKSFPFWKSTNEIGWLERRCFDNTDLVWKTEYWLIEKKLDMEEASETFITSRKGIFQYDRSGVDREHEYTEFAFIYDDPDTAIILLTGEVSVLKNHQLLFDKLKWSRKWKKLEPRPKSYDPITKEILCIADGPPRQTKRDRKFYYQLCGYGLDGKVRTRISHVPEGEGDTNFFPSGFFSGQPKMIGQTLFAFDYPFQEDFNEISFWSLDLVVGPEWKELGRISFTPPQQGVLGWSISPDKQFLAVGWVGVYRLDEDMHIGEKLRDLEMIYPAWSPDSKKLIGLKTALPGKEDIQPSKFHRNFYMGENTITIEDL